ncbi:MAG TPA: DUF1538 domain-containing protein [Treponemataceae bacterium]|nr:DUF1538 domain-containing protein [Treponemataceae bacterium]
MIKLLEILGSLWATLKTIVPLVLTLVVFQVFILKKPLHNTKEFVVGFVLTVLGLHFFLEGASMCLIPLGESVGRNIVILEKKWLIVFVAFIIGYFGTLVEPALKVLALQVEEVSEGAISHKVLIHVVALGFGLGMGLGVFKILMNISYTKIIVPLLILILILIIFTPESFVSIAMDSGSATTGSVNIPLNMLIAVGLAGVLAGVDPLLAGFGMVGLTSIGAVISVLTLGILTRI